MAANDFVDEPPVQTRVARRVFSTPEVINRIMQSSERDTTAKCMRVCQVWKDIARDHTWRELGSPMPLIDLLAPVGRKKGDRLGDELVSEALLLLRCTNMYNTSSLRAA